MAEVITSNFPTSLDDTTSLLQSVVNLKSFTLSGNHSDTTTDILTTATISGISAPCYLLIDSEIIHVGSISVATFKTCTRGADGTTAATHTGGATVYHIIAANYHNQLRRAIIAIETELGIAPSGSAADVTTRLSVGQLFLTAAGGWPSTTAGCATNAKSEMTTNKQNFYTLDFDTTTMEYAEWTVAMPSDWNAGTITANFYWMHAATTTNFGVVWQIEGRAYANDDALDQAWGTLQEIADTGGTTSDLYITAATPAMTFAGTPAASQLVQFRVGRQVADASDTMAIDARLLGAMINYTRT